MVAFKKLRSVSTLLFVDASKNDFTKLPNIVKSNLSDKSLGRMIPRIVVMKNDLSKCLSRVRYEEWKDSSKVVRKVKKAIDEAGESQQEQSKEEEPSKLEVPEKKRTVDQTLYTWVNLEGKEVKARFVKLNSSSVTLKTIYGKSADYPLSRLSEESKAQAKRLAAQAIEAKN